MFNVTIDGVKYAIENKQQAQKMIMQEHNEVYEMIVPLADGSILVFIQNHGVVNMYVYEKVNK